MAADIQEQLNISIVPEPQRLSSREGVFKAAGGLSIIVESGDEQDRFAAQYLARCLKEDLDLECSFCEAASGRQRSEAAQDRPRVHLKQLAASQKMPAEGYTLEIRPDAITIAADDAAGVYYGCMTLRQCLTRHGHDVYAPCLEIEDSPDMPHRAVHYDTKHHQDKYEYVEDFIRELSAWKINILIWEWEDKFAYQKHPMVGAPGAFTKEQVQSLNKLALRHHVQIVPLVQGLGHVSYILKHRCFDKLREIPDSTWEFCPLKEGSYEVLFSLWDEAIDATPGSQYLHIGTDEAYELGLGTACGCRDYAEKDGRDALMQVFIRRCNEHIQSRGRTMISWGGGWKAGRTHLPPKSMILGAYTLDFEGLKEAKANGYPCWIFAPNPGIEPLFLTLLPHAFGTMWRDDPHYVKKGNWQEVKDTVGRAAAEKACPGMITTSWDDGGLHNQAWMPRFICGGQYSWKGDSCDVTTFARRYFRSYFGPAARDMRELFQNMMEGALFWYDTFQRGVFQFCEIGKIHAPDFPREGLEFNDFWRKRYVYLVNRARAMKITVLRAIEVIDDNLARNVRHRYDLEVFRACAEIMRHNCDLIVGLWDLEEAISWASDLHFADRWPCYAPPGFQTRVEYPDWAKALEHLKKAQAVLETNNADRDRTYADLVAVFERTRLPKGLSLPGKPYVFDRERARHLANRTPDMSFMILDEKLLGLDEYLEKLKVLIEGYEKEVSGNRETS